MRKIQTFVLILQSLAPTGGNCRWQLDYYMWKFKPILKHTIWGGKRIAALKGLQSSDLSVGESWEISSLPGSVSVVAEGPDQGKSILDLVALQGASLLGNENFHKFGNEFPLLIKFIDADKDLSIQVHPDDEMARRFGQKGKTEMWYVVDAKPDTRICNGFRHEVHERDYSQLVASGNIEDALNYIPIVKDDVYYIPAGRIHAIGAGAFLVEVQQASDVTYRVYDYMRRDSDGSLRELHVDLAREALDFGDVGAGAVECPINPDGSTTLMHSPYFTTCLYRTSSVIERDLTSLDSFVVIVVTEGACTLISDSESVNIKAGETILIPASAQHYTIKAEKPTVLLETYIL